MTSSFKNLTINDTGYLQLPSGTSAQRSNYIVQSFTTAGTSTWTCPTDVTSVEVLVVAGGGGGGGENGSAGAGGGGGGAGGLVYNNAFSVTPGNGYTVTVGAGGAGSTSNNSGSAGSNSVFATLTAIGGGYGSPRATAGGNGGSGGGSGLNGAAGTSTQNSSGSAGFGNAGGAGISLTYCGSAGGGAGSAGQSPLSPYGTGGAGGLGQAFSITGVSQYYAAGGGGGAATVTDSPGLGGNGIGGSGGFGTGGSNGTNGTANTGSGGGGGCGNNGNTKLGGAGATGIVVLRYKQVVKFTSTGSSTWTVPAGVNQVEVLVVAGGGGAGGAKRGGGGGAGGVIYKPYFTVTPGAVLNVTVGAGGAAATGATTGNATAGSNSLFGSSTNLITNGNLTSNTTGWTDPAAGAEGTFVAGGSGVTITATNAIDPPPCIYQAITCVVGATYQVAATRVSGTASIVVNVADGVTTGGGANATNVLYFTAATATGTLAKTFVATQTTHYIFLRINENATTNVTMTGISVYDVTNTILAIGGGKGGGYSPSLGGGAGGYGGSGGGSASGEATGNETGGTGSTGQGTSGGNIVGTIAIGTGGGGAGGAGESRYATTFNGGNGGPGIASNITGITRYYGGGGGGGAQIVSYNGGLGGLGGGGNGGGITAGDSTLGGTAGIANTGGGGGGGGDNVTGNTAGAGGSGIVIISYNSVNTTLTQRPGMIRMNPASTYTANGIESFKHIQSSSVAGLNWAAPDGLVCLLDAGNTQSYPGSGTAWYDLSGNNRNWTINPSYAVWNSAGQQSYFNFDGTSTLRNYQNSSSLYPFSDSPITGPASDKMGFNGSQEHTCIAVTRVTASSNNFFFSFALTPQSGAGDFTSRWSTHMYYGGGSFYYDYPGCCNGNTRIYKNVQDPSWVGNLKIATWRCRRTAYPQRQFFRNNAIETDSGNENTGTANWNRPDVGILGAAYNGRIYYIAWYNRALTDAELTTQWAYLTARFGIT